MSKKVLYPIILAVLLFTVFLGCKGPAGKPGTPNYRSYRDIPGVTTEEIRAIEAIRQQTDSFVYAMETSSDTFRGEKGEILGFSALFCEWLTEMFEIPFIPEIYKWGDILAGLETHAIDFTGELVATSERQETHFMTGSIAEHVVKTFQIEGSPPLAEIAALRPVRYVFLRDVAIRTVITRLLQGEYEIIQVYDNDSAYDLLKSGEADVFFTTSPSEAAFDGYGDVVASDFYPFVFASVSLATQNPALAPVISVVQKALASGSIRHVNELHEHGFQQYKRHKLFSQFSTEELTYIQNHPTVPFAASNSNYPVSFYNTYEKEWQGISFDMLKEVENLTGLRFELAHDEDATWQTLLSMLENGEASMLSGIVRSNARRGLFLWADTPILTDYYALISKSGYRDISLDEIWYEKIGIINDTSYAEVFNRWFTDHQNTTEYKDTNAAIDALERGEVDMIMANQGHLLMITHYRELTGYKANVIFDYTFESDFGFNRDAPALRSIVDKALKIIDTKIITEHWTHKTYDYRVKLARVQIPWVVGALTLLFVTLVIVMLLFRKQGEEKRLEDLVQKRTAELNRQQTLAQEINNAAVLLLESDLEDTPDSMTKGMQMIAKCIEVDRISIWQNQRKDNDEKLYYTLVNQWANGDLPKLDGETDFMYQEVLPGWEKIFKQKLCVNGPVENFEEPERSHLGAFTIQSLLAMPIYV